MSLKEQLLADMKSALKEKNTIKKDTVQIVRAGILQVEKDENIVLEDEQILDVISREVKKRKDVLPDYERSGRQDLINDINVQLEILNSYLPEQLSEDGLTSIIDEVIAEVGATSMKDMGSVMNTVLPKVKGRAEGKVVSQIIKSRLN